MGENACRQTTAALCCRSENQKLPASVYKAMKSFTMRIFSVLLITFAALTACGQKTIPSIKEENRAKKPELDTLQTAYFASGCFWCVEGVFESVDGVREVVSGYTGGQTENPTYEQVCTGRTGHAESVEIYYDSTKVSYETLLKVFFGSHDPSTLNRQGPDGGTQYRSAIFYKNPREKALAKAYIDSLLDNEVYPKVTTELSKLTIFYPAEIYHQNYECQNPNNPYVQNVSIPRIEGFRNAFPELVKPELKNDKK
jgi:peptide-methionine (S)-S-oxide reductase